MKPVYRDDGLMVGWYKDLPRKMLRVHVWQILINGKKPTRLPGSQDDKIVVETVAMKNVPLVEAVANNDLKAVTALLAEGADANVKNSVEMPVLIMAIRRGSARIVEALLKHGADPNVRTVDTDLTPSCSQSARTRPCGQRLPRHWWPRVQARMQRAGRRAPGFLVSRP